MLTHAQEHTIKIRLLMVGDDTEADANEMRVHLETAVRKLAEYHGVLGHEVELAKSAKQISLDHQVMTAQLSLGFAAVGGER